MNKKPSLVIMAAGMGSRFGSQKQIEPVDHYGNVIIDYSIYDAKRAGFEKVVFIIKEEDKSAFELAVGNRISEQMEVSYVFQDIDNIPEAFIKPENRIKPWGTGHAVMCLDNIVVEPFAVINADDYYGKKAFELLYDFLCKKEKLDIDRYMMVGYLVKNTVTKNGYVSRGICDVDSQGLLLDVKEYTHIGYNGDDIVYSDETTTEMVNLEPNQIVSMNMWGFFPGIIQELKDKFVPFLSETLEINPLKGEYFLPSVVNMLIKEGKAEVVVKPTHDEWYGMTYAKDKDIVVAAIDKLIKQGVYPEDLWNS